MSKFSQSSQTRLDTCNYEIRHIMNTAIISSPIDFGIPAYGGKRSQSEQYQLFLDGESKCDGVSKLSKHQSGDAVDIIAYVPSVGGYTYERDYYLMLAGHILATAKRLGYEFRWGGDWDSDNDLKDQTFNDLCHFELVR